MKMGENAQNRAKSGIVIRYLGRKELTLGEDASSHTLVKKWAGEFKRGRESLGSGDDPRPSGKATGQRPSPFLRTLHTVFVFLGVGDVVCFHCFHCSSVSVCLEVADLYHVQGHESLEKILMIHLIKGNIVPWHCAESNLLLFKTRSGCLMGPNKLKPSTFGVRRR